MREKGEIGKREGYGKKVEREGESVGKGNRERGNVWKGGERGSKGESIGGRDEVKEKERRKCRRE